LKIVSYASRNPDRRRELSDGVTRILKDRPFDLAFCENDAEALRALPDAEILLAHHLNPDMLRVAKKLRWLHRTDAGIEKTLFPEFVTGEIILTNTRGIHAQPMAEWALGILFYIAQRFDAITSWKQDHLWKPTKTTMTTQRFILAGKRALIVGWGEIGRPLGALLRNIGLEIEAVASRPRKEPVPLHELNHLPQIISKFDIVVITLPHTAQTDNLFNESLLSKMKKGSILVNLARGKVLDETALINALANGPLAFAALDVFREEPLPENSPLFDLPNLIMTPHVSGNFPDYTKRMHELFLENLQLYVNGQTLRFIVDKQRGY
jgi:phosphoglycerate dehydrogenase-like enzyme